MSKAKVKIISRATSNKTGIASQTKKIKKDYNPPSLKGREIEEAIRLEAYNLYLLRCGGPADPMGDWLRAEKIVLKGL